MHPARIAELLQPFLSPIQNPCHSESGRRPGEACPERSRREPAVLSATQLNSISTYIDLLLRWNARVNLTGIRDREEIVTRHFGESLLAARHLFPDAGHERKTENNSSAPSACSAVKSSARVADLGSGAGFPGLPIKLWAPQISLTLIESNQKKATFLREVTRALTLTDVNVQNASAETLPSRTFDVVTFRAVERFATILPVAAALLAPAGRLALLVSSSQLETIHAALPSFTWSTPIPLPQSQSRILLISR
ncbi:MAG: 16S rRNA (guanine(527)-N(7))-methyltransferase RsmG [Candidatus Sulfotelmatobacter sp.]